MAHLRSDIQDELVLLFIKYEKPQREHQKPQTQAEKVFLQTGEHAVEHDGAHVGNKMVHRVDLHELHHGVRQDLHGVEDGREVWSTRE